jgi:Ca-activated chloride channel homolog
MILLTPLALLLLALAVPIILMYVLKLRREDRTVPSTILWRRAVEDVQANAPWQRLRPTILLLLQLLAVAALVLTLAEPAYTQGRTVTGDLVVIIDESYGMQAHDVGRSRFSAALAQAHTLARQLTPGNVMSVIGMSSQPRLALVESDDQATIGRAIDRLHAGDVSPNFLAALSVASSLARSGETTRVIVLTSRDSGITGLPVAVSFPVTIVRIGGRLRDLGITAFQAIHRGGHTEAVARVRNFGVDVASSDLDLEVDGQLADVRPVRVSAGTELNLFWTALPLSAERLRIQLTRRDDFDGDKMAWAVVPKISTHSVLLVSGGNVFLQTALASNPSLTLALVQPQFYNDALARTFDLVVFDRSRPQVLPPLATLLVAPPAGRLGSLRFGPETRAGSVVAATTSPASAELNALLKYVDFSDVHVARARTVNLPPWMQPLAVSGNLPLLAAGDSGTARIGLITFDLEKSDWPLRVSFPVAIQNLLRYLVPGLAVGTSNVSVGQSVPLIAATRGRIIEVTRPDGVVDQIHAPFSSYANTAQPGFYLVRELGGVRPSEASFAVDFFHPRSAPAPGPPDVSFGHVRPTYGRSTTVSVNLAWAVGITALALLSVEWWFAFRR